MAFGLLNFQRSTIGCRSNRPHHQPLMMHRKSIL